MQVLGHPETGNPKNKTLSDAAHRQRTCLIGICKDMMSSMDPLREPGLQGLAVETFLVTRKFSSTIFCWKALHKIQEGESMNTISKSWLWIASASSKGLSPTFL